MIILGINSAYHESSVAFLVDGRLRFFLEEERVSRVKHAKAARIDNPHELPLAALQLGLTELGITFDEIDVVAYSFDRAGRRQNSGVDARVVPGSWGSPAGEDTFHACLQRVPEILESLGTRPLGDRLRWVPHHVAHAASAFFCSPFDDALVLAIDGIGEFDSLLAAHGTGNHLEAAFGMPYPHSLGLLWEKICAYLGFSEYDACKVMGLASYGDPAPCRDGIRRFADTSPARPLWLDGDKLNFRVPDTDLLAEVFGPARRPGDPIAPHHEQVAAALQEFTDAAVLNLVADLRQRAASRHLCLAGGVALNCVSNTALARLAGLDGLFIQPAANDAGSALGAALWVWHQELGRPRSWTLTHAYHGPGYTDAELTAALTASGLPFHRVARPAVTAADLVADGKIVGWFQGRMEMGPRALGNRSLLADPRRPDMREILNQKVKHREAFRPFAPSVLAEHAATWFEMPPLSAPADFMLLAVPVPARVQERIPAVVHVDGTSRLQLVHADVNPLYHDLIGAFAARTGVPLVLNTSFNDSEPIVMSPADALATFAKTRIDALLLGDNLVTRPEIGH